MADIAREPHVGLHLARRVRQDLLAAEPLCLELVAPSIVHQPIVSGPTSRWNCSAHAFGASRAAWFGERSEPASRAAPARQVEGVVVPLEGAEARRAAPPAPDRWRPPRSPSTGHQPISGSGSRRTGAPSADASICAPRQMPSTGVPSATSAASVARSRASHGSSSV